MIVQVDPFTLPRSNQHKPQLDKVSIQFSRHAIATQVPVPLETSVPGFVAYATSEL